MFSGSINLELYWQGSYTLGHNWTIQAIDIELPDSDQKIWANLNTDLPSAEIQRLKFWVGTKENDSEESEFDSIECPIYFAKIMQITGRIFQADAHKDAIPILINKPSLFKSEETYKIKILNENNNLWATIQKKVSAVVSQDI